MKSMFAAALVAASLGFGAQAENFTFTNTGTLVAMVQIPGDANAPRVAAVSDFKGDTMVGGRTLPTEGQCAAWPSLPGDIFQGHGQCTFSDATGKGYVRFGCNPGKTPTEDNCVGGIWGTAGAYAGRSGTMAWHNHLNADGKTSSSSGAGQWGD